MDRNESTADTENGKKSINQSQDQKHVIYPFEETGEKLSKEEEENIEQFKEAQTERD